MEFTPSAIEAIAGASQNNPRFVNVIADRALEIGFSRGVRSIDRQIAAAAIARSGLEVPRSIVTPVRLAVIAAALALLAVVALWRPFSGRPAPAEQPAPVGERPSPAIEPPSPAIEPPSPAIEPPPAPSPPSDGVLAAADSHLVVVGSFENAERAAEVARELSARGARVHSPRCHGQFQRRDGRAVCVARGSGRGGAGHQGASLSGSADCDRAALTLLWTRIFDIATAACNLFARHLRQPKSLGHLAWTRLIVPCAAADEQNS